MSDLGNLATGQTGKPLLSVRNLRKTFTKKKSWFGKASQLHAVDGIDLDVMAGETVGLVGESGSGKSTLGRTILRLVKPTSGEVIYDGQDLAKISSREMNVLRRNVQIIFQDPYSSLHPRMTVRQILYEGLLAGGETPRFRWGERAEELVVSVGLGLQHLDVFPHKLSGGQRQRVAIARALSVNPSFIVADEAVSALDVSIQAQILNLLANVQRDFGLTYLFVSHDLNVIRYLSDRIVVLYQGRVVEQASAEKLFAAPLHPYTALLFDAMPSADRIGKGVGSRPIPPSLRADPAGDAVCRFYSRCPKAMDACTKVRPPLVEVEKGHKVACLLVGQHDTQL